MRVSADSSSPVLARLVRQQSSELRGTTRATRTRSLEVLRTAQTTVAWYRLRRAVDASTLREAVPPHWRG